MQRLTDASRSAQNCFRGKMRVWGGPRAREGADSVSRPVGSASSWLLPCLGCRQRSTSTSTPQPSSPALLAAPLSRIIRPSSSSPASCHLSPRVDHPRRPHRLSRAPAVSPTSCPGCRPLAGLLLRRRQSTSQSRSDSTCSSRRSGQVASARSNVSGLGLSGLPSRGPLGGRGRWERRGGEAHRRVRQWAGVGRAGWHTTWTVEDVCVCLADDGQAGLAEVGVVGGGACQLARLLPSRVGRRELNDPHRRHRPSTRSKFEPDIVHQRSVGPSASSVVVSVSDSLGTHLLVILPPPSRPSSRFVRGLALPSLSTGH